MQYVVALALAGGTAWLIASIGTPTMDRAISAVGQLVGGWRGDGWPHGVQEEDRDRPWVPAGGSRQVAAVTIEETAARAATSRVRARTTAR